MVDAFAADTVSLTRYGVGEVVAPESVASSDEALLAGITHDEANGLRAFLLNNQPDLWAHVMHVIAVEQGRMSRQPHDAYTGKITQPDLVADVQDQLGPTRRWSASQLNEYGTCAFRFFASSSYWGLRGVAGGWQECVVPALFPLGSILLRGS